MHLHFDLHFDTSRWLNGMMQIRSKCGEDIFGVGCFSTFDETAWSSRSRRRAVPKLQSVSISRGKTTTSIQVTAYRWIQLVAISPSVPADQASDRRASTFGIPIPVIHAAGPRINTNMIRNVSASRNVLLHPARYSKATPCRYIPIMSPTVVVTADRCTLALIRLNSIECDKSRVRVSSSASDPPACSFSKDLLHSLASQGTNSCNSRPSLLGRNRFRRVSIYIARFQSKSDKTGKASRSIRPLDNSTSAENPVSNPPAGRTR